MGSPPVAIASVDTVHLDARSGVRADADANKKPTCTGEAEIEAEKLMQLIPLALHRTLESLQQSLDRRLDKP